MNKVSMFDKRGKYDVLSNVRLHPITAKRLVNEKIDCVINSVYFEVPTGKIDYIITFFKCIIERLNRANKEEV